MESAKVGVMKISPPHVPVEEFLSNMESMMALKVEMEMSKLCSKIEFLFRNLERDLFVLSHKLDWEVSLLSEKMKRIEEEVSKISANSRVPVQRPRISFKLRPPPRRFPLPGPVHPAFYSESDDSTHEEGSGESDEGSGADDASEPALYSESEDSTHADGSGEHDEGSGADDASEPAFYFESEDSTHEESGADDANEDYENNSAGDLGIEFVVDAAEEYDENCASELWLLEEYSKAEMLSVQLHTLPLIKRSASA